MSDDILVRILWQCEDTRRAIAALHDTENFIANEVKAERAQLARIIHLLERQHAPMRLVAGVGFNVQSGEILTMSGTNQITLTNAADPSKATRYLGFVDLANGTTLPTVTSSNPTLLPIVAATSLNATNQFVFGAYPVDTAAETNDAVTVTISLAGQPDIVRNFTISGTPVPPPETDTLDASSAVAAWANAPTLPGTPA